MAGGTFLVGQDILESLQTRDDVFWSVIEWAAEFYYRVGRAATCLDLLRDHPKLEYRGLYEKQDVASGSQEAGA